jgi:hypothetical protein
MNKTSLFYFSNHKALENVQQSLDHAAQYREDSAFFDALEAHCERVESVDETDFHTPIAPDLEETENGIIFNYQALAQQNNVKMNISVPGEISCSSSVTSGSNHTTNTIKHNPATIKESIAQIINSEVVKKIETYTYVGSFSVEIGKDGKVFNMCWNFDVTKDK